MSNSKSEVVSIAEALKNKPLTLKDFVTSPEERAGNGSISYNVRF